MMKTYAANILSLLTGIAGHAQTPLPIPGTLSGPVIDLSLMEGTTEFHAGEVVATYGYNGNILGPTLILEHDEVVTFNVTNTLPDLTTTHWHGMHVSAANDGGPHSLIYPNTTWSPSFPVGDRASTFWYHPHGHGLTDHQVSMGAAGMIIVRNTQEAALALPRTYGVDDIPLILQTKAIVDGQIMLHTGLDSVVVVNGVRNAWKELPAQVVRLRCLNAASERTFLLGFSNGMSFHVIGADGGLLAAPEELNRLRLMPGERTEILVDLTSLQGQDFTLLSFASELPNGFIGSTTVGDGTVVLEGYAENGLNGNDHTMVSFTVGAPTQDAIQTIPQTLVPTFPLQEADADITRTFTLAPEVMDPMGMIEGPFTINSAMMDMDVINETIPLGNTEIWEFQNNTRIAHPMHIHDVQFNILDRNGAEPEVWETGWKDVVLVPPMGMVRTIMRFDDFADPDMPYMYHCHMLMHEDEGMMGQFVVVDANGIEEDDMTQNLHVWPNPSAGRTCTVRWPDVTGAVQVTVMDACGRTVHRTTLSNTTSGVPLELPLLAAGHYTLRLTSTAGRTAQAALTLTDTTH